MTSSDPTTRRRVFVTYLLAYLLAGVTSAIGAGCWVVGRQALLAFMRAISHNRYVVGTVDKFGVIVLTIAWLILVYGSAHVYSKAVAKIRLWRRWSAVTGLEIAFILLSLLVRVVSERILVARLVS